MPSAPNAQSELSRQAEPSPRPHALNIMESFEKYERGTWNLAASADSLPILSKPVAKVPLDPSRLIPHFVRVRSEDGTPFRIHKELAMYYSDWFQQRLGPGSEARADDKMILGSVDNETMVAFLEWLYKQTKWQPPTFAEAGYARFTTPLDDEGLTKAFIFADRYSVPDMKPDIIERAVQLFKHTEPSYKAINMACEDLPDWSPFVRLLVDAHCAHQYQYHRSYSTQFASKDGLHTDSGVDIEHGSDTSTIVAMDVDSQSECSNAGSEAQEWSLPSSFNALVDAKFRVLEQNGAENVILNRFDYRV